jgi:DNA-binding MarR family transcriptional regulator
MVTKISRIKTASEVTSGRFLKRFYPFHYLVGEVMEGALRGEDLTHHETVILWMIHSEGKDGLSLPRKEIERLIANWYELGSPAITKVLKRMATGVTPLITIRDNPRSAREKLVVLTRTGEEEIIRMMDRANTMIDDITVGWTNDEIEDGLHFLQRVIERVAEIRT